jgi:predicted nucleic acid-binding protein
MALYVDSSALLKRYLEEPDSDTADGYLPADTAWFSGRHTCVKVRRNLGRALRDDELVRVRSGDDSTNTAPRP